MGENSRKFIQADIPSYIKAEAVERTDDEERDDEEREDEEYDVEPFLPFSQQDDTPAPTLHELECRAAEVGWERIRKSMMDVITENAAMPVGQVGY